MKNERLTFQFDITKSLEATAAFIRCAGGKLNYMKLLKLLYLADRESFKETYTTITGDQPYSMKDGPVLSEIYNCIKENDPTTPHYRRQINASVEQREWQRIWGKYIEVLPDKCVRLKAEVIDIHLSPYETQLIQQFSDQFRMYNQYDVRDWLHEDENCPEWHKITSGRELIEFESWMEHHLGCMSPQSQHEIREISREASGSSLREGEVSDEELLELLGMEAD